MASDLLFGQHPAELVVNRLGKTTSDGNRTASLLETFFLQYNNLRGQQARASSDFVRILSVCVCVCGR